MSESTLKIEGGLAKNKRTGERDGIIIFTVTGDKSSVTLSLREAANLIDKLTKAVLEIHSDLEELNKE